MANDETSDAWRAIQRLAGRWEGTASGSPGSGSQVRQYEPILRGRFLMGTNRTRWKATATEPDGEVHEDLAVLSFDRAADQLVMRSFFVEGFACEYRCVEADPAAGRFVFVADRVENGPPGLRARETFVLDGDTLESRFDLASGDGDFRSYTVEQLVRA